MPSLLMDLLALERKATHLSQEGSLTRSIHTDCHAASRHHTNLTIKNASDCQHSTRCRRCRPILCQCLRWASLEHSKAVGALQPQPRPSGKHPSSSQSGVGGSGAASCQSRVSGGLGHKGGGAPQCGPVQGRRSIACLASHQGRCCLGWSAGV